MAPLNSKLTRLQRTDGGRTKRGGYILCERGGGECRITLHKDICSLDWEKG